MQTDAALNIPMRRPFHNDPTSSIAPGKGNPLAAHEKALQMARTTANERFAVTYIFRKG
jgi:fumarate hydratase class II